MQAHNARSDTFSDESVISLRDQTKCCMGIQCKFAYQCRINLQVCIFLCEVYICAFIRPFFRSFSSLLHSFENSSEIECG